MSDKDQTRLDWELARAGIYRIGHFAVALIQFAGGAGAIVCGLALLMQFSNPRMDQIAIGFGCTFAATWIWHWATKKLNAVGKRGDDYFHNPFKGPDEPMF